VVWYEDTWVSSEATVRLALAGRPALPRCSSAIPVGVSGRTTSALVRRCLEQVADADRLGEEAAEPLRFAGQVRAAELSPGRVLHDGLGH